MKLAKTTFICFLSVGMFIAFDPSAGYGADTSQHGAYQYCESWVPYRATRITFAQHQQHRPIWPSWSGIICNGIRQVGTIRMDAISDASAVRSGTWSAVTNESVFAYGGHLRNFEDHFPGMTLVMTSSRDNCRLTLLQTPYQFGEMTFRIVAESNCPDLDELSMNEILLVLWRVH